MCYTKSMQIKRNYKLLIGLPILVVAFSALTIALLFKFTPLKQSSTSPVAVVAPKPAEIIKQYQQPAVISQLAELYTKKATPLEGLDAIGYTTTGSYGIVATASDFVQYEQKDKSAQTNASAVKASTEAFLKKNNLKKKETVEKKTTENKTAGVASLNPLYVLFDSDQTVCQMVDQPPSAGTNAILELSCVDKATITAQYTKINKLLELYSGPKSDIAGPSFIRLVTTTEGDKTLTMTDLYGLQSGKSATSLFFASIGKSTKYIGQLPLSMSATRKAQPAPDRTLPASLRAAVNDPQYGDFLVKNVR